MLKLRDKNEILNSLKNEYDKAELSMLDVFSQTMTKDDLKDLIRYNGYNVKLSLNKPEMSSELALAIEEEFVKTLGVITSTELMELEKLVLYNMSFVDFGKDEEMIELRDKYSLGGFIYFLESKEHYPEKILVVPKEIINKLIENIDKFDYERLEKREELINIIIGLTNLYGVFHISHLEAVLSGYGIDIDENLLKECLLNGEKFNKIFYSKDENIVHESCTINDSYTEIINNVKSQEYYVPSYDEAIRYAKNGMDLNRKSFIEVFEYLKKLTKNKFFDVNEVAYMIYDLCIMDVNMHEIIEELNSSEIAYGSEKNFKELLTLIINLSNDCRKWINRGFTQNELLKNSSNKIIEINKENKRVGRNDPCPCGSGKKYKKCCMLNDN